MKKVIFILLMLSSFSAESFVDKVTVLRRWNNEMNHFHYVINLGIIENISTELNYSQTEALKKLIESSKNSLFLFPDYTLAQPLNDALGKLSGLIIPSIGEKLQNDRCLILQKYAHTEKVPTNSLAPLFGSMAIIAYQLGMIKSLTGISLKVKDLADIILKPYESILENYLTIQKLLKESVISKTLMHDYKLYLEFFEECDIKFQKDYEFAQKLLNIDIDLIEYLVKNYAKHINQDPEYCAGLLSKSVENTEALRFALDLGKYYMEGTICQGLIRGLISIIELSALQEIIQNQEAKKIFVFSNIVNSEPLNKMLLRLGYEKIFEHNSKTNLLQMMKVSRLEESNLRNIPGKELVEMIRNQEVPAIKFIMQNQSAAKPVPAEIFHDLAQENFIESLTPIDDVETESHLNELLEFTKSNANFENDNKQEETEEPEAELETELQNLSLSEKDNSETQNEKSKEKE